MIEIKLNGTPLKVIFPNGTFIYFNKENECHKKIDFFKVAYGDSLSASNYYYVTDTVKVESIKAEFAFNGEQAEVKYKNLYYKIPAYIYNYKSLEELNHNMKDIHKLIKNEASKLKQQFSQLNLMNFDYIKNKDEITRIITTLEAYTKCEMIELNHQYWNKINMIKNNIEAYSLLQKLDKVQDKTGLHEIILLPNVAEAKAIIYRLVMYNAEGIVGFTNE